MKRRNFIKKASMTGVAGMLGAYSSQAMLFASCKRELSGDDVIDAIDEQIVENVDEVRNLLYNGIELPEVWPPSNLSPDNFDPMPVPYLDNPPEVIPIDVGRQLWVDDFLIKETTLEREYHLAVKYEGNPILTAEKEWEKWNQESGATPVSGGIYWDPADQLFKMWYRTGWSGSLAYATSNDGIHWNRPDLGVSQGTNIIFHGIIPVSTSVILDHFTLDTNQRFKMFMRRSGGGVRPSEVRVSSDGIHWTNPVVAGGVGDRSTIFYNPFRNKWVYSIRSSGAALRSGIGRARYYVECNSFIEEAGWGAEDPMFWTGADRLDPPDPVIGDTPQLYNLDAVGYESLMLGVFQIHRGPHNSVGEETGIPKITELTLAYSRDGFHWHRPDRRTFIASTRQKDDWDRGYVQSVGGVCLIVGDELWFYFIGFKGNENETDDVTRRRRRLYANGSTGLAKLRRDGFASLNATQQEGSVTTRLLTFKGRYLFVNVDCPAGELKAEIIDEHGQVIAPFSLTNSEPLSVNRTCVAMSWKGVDDLSAIAGRQVSFRFHLKNGKFYAFWVSPDTSGASHGYVAAGGPGFTEGIDTVGLNGMV